MSDIRKLETRKEILELSVDAIMPSPYQPRRQFDNISISRLAESIKEYGVLQPINVRLINGKTYELISGERRLKAAKQAGLETIPAIVIDAGDNESAILCLIENLQRQDLNFFEEAEGYQNLINDYGFTQEEVAVKLGKNQSTIANKLRLLRLPRQAQKKILENGLTERHARAVLKIPDEEIQLMAIHKIIEDELNVKKTEELIDNILFKMQTDSFSRVEQNVKRSFGDIRLITNTVKRSVDLIRESGVPAVYEAAEKEDAYEILIRIPYRED